MGKRADTGKLTEKHWKALQLLASNTFKKKEIAAKCGFNEDYFYDLCEGNTKKCGPVATTFQTEIEKLNKELSKKIKSLTRQNKELVLDMLNEQLVAMKKAKKPKPVKDLTTILNSLNKATPNVEIDQLNQFNSMTPEEMAVEFKRLQSVARELNRGRVPGSTKSGTGAVPKSVGTRNNILTEPEA